LKGSILIGDKSCDNNKGRMAGHDLVVRTGYGAQFENALTADFMVDNLTAATRLIRCHLWKERTVLHGY
jgi:hypothetical protein